MDVGGNRLEWCRIMTRNLLSPTNLSPWCLLFTTSFLAVTCSPHFKMLFRNHKWANFPVAAAPSKGKPFLEKLKVKQIHQNWKAIWRKLITNTVSFFSLHIVYSVWWSKTQNTLHKSHLNPFGTTYWQQVFRLLRVQEFCKIKVSVLLYPFCLGMKSEWFGAGSQLYYTVVKQTMSSQVQAIGNWPNTSSGKMWKCLWWNKVGKMWSYGTCFTACFNKCSSVCLPWPFYC